LLLDVLIGVNSWVKGVIRSTLGLAKKSLVGWRKKGEGGAGSEALKLTQKKNLRTRRGNH